jgi:hypothetical protein
MYWYYCENACHKLPNIQYYLRSGRNFHFLNQLHGGRALALILLGMFRRMPNETKAKDAEQELATQYLESAGKKNKKEEGDDPR